MRVLVLASICHAMFFVLMGTSHGFPYVLAGYACAAFARAFLTGKLHLLSCSLRPHSKCLCTPISNHVRQSAAHAENFVC